MSQSPHLIIDKGPDRGRSLIIPPTGARFGRASKNDVVLTDSLLSRHHCRFFFKDDHVLHVADLASANQTWVNGTAVAEARLSVGDIVLIGETELRVLHTQENSPQPVKEAGLKTPLVGAGRRLAAIFNARPEQRRRGLMALAAVIVIVAALGLAYFLTKSGTGAGSAPLKPAPPAPLPVLAIEYEKVDADTNGIFRYVMTLTPDQRLAVTIADTGKTRVAESGSLAEALVRDLAAFLETSGYFELLPDYRGLQPAMLSQRDLTVTLGRRAHRVTVVNRAEPPAFQAVRERIEKLGETELGLWAVQFSTEQRLAMALEAYQRAKTAHSQREVQYGNLSSALDAFAEADRLLQTIEPKPDYYPDLLAAQNDARALLDKQYVDLSFNADLAIRRSAWEEAARQLRTIREMIPNRNDQRYQDTTRKLIEVEQRIENLK